MSSAISSAIQYSGLWTFNTKQSFDRILKDIGAGELPVQNTCWRSGTYNRRRCGNCTLTFGEIFLVASQPKLQVWQPTLRRGKAMVPIRRGIFDEENI